MLLKRVHLDGILSGDIDLAFRRWKRPSVKAGTVLHTAIGQVAIRSIKPIGLEDISEADAHRAGFESLKALLIPLQKAEHGTIYRISLAFHAPDPRVILRSRQDLSDAEFESIENRLARLDQYSRLGQWTGETLCAIETYPGRRAVELAVILNKEKDWLKVNIRKLKNLGLTISREVGYEISPLGKSFLQWQGARGR
ncbi:MAG: hypothetical protein AAGA85_11730 [Bacteroidota bacterium]